MNCFGDVYRGKKVLITGNTGFKGCWLSLWLKNLGATVYGVSDCVPTTPALFEVAGLDSQIENTFEDVRNLEPLSKLVNSIKPDFLFHLAAQPIVKLAYSDPVGTMSSNIMGTVNVLESLRQATFDCTAIIITSDKCYENNSWEWGYKETDALGGSDPYSASKAAAEIVVKTYFESFFQPKDSTVKLCSVRAGNVIGGGDWAANRLVPDIFKSWSENNTVEIRSPDSTRPWQHVLEPLSGYLNCGQLLYSGSELNGMSFNFGPDARQDNSVLDVINEMSNHWQGSHDGTLFNVIPNAGFHEADLLKLNCDRALHYLDWKPTLGFEETIEFTSSWYNSFYNSTGVDMLEFTQEQIRGYVASASQQGIAWAK